MRRTFRKTLPTLEGLEGRMLLSGVASSFQPDRIAYTTPQGSHVVITLYGAGSLAGSTLGANGALNLVFSNTNASTGIVSRVSGGTGRALLQSILNQDVAPQDLSGIGGSALNVMNLKNFDLVAGGQINLTSGVHSLFLNSVGSNTQVNLRELPPSFTTQGTTETSTAEGVTLTYNSNSQGGLILVNVSGQFTPGTNIVEPKTTVGVGASVAVNPGPPPAPPGVVAVINHINGTPRIPASVGDPQIFGYDPTANTLIRFDATTGAQLQTIPLTGMGTMTAGVALARDNSQLVALVGNGNTIFAFNAVTGASVGQFSTSNLASLGFNTVGGLAATGSQTIVADPTAANGGVAVSINLAASLASGQAVPAGQPFNPQGQFQISGGATGLPASDTIYMAGSAHFNTFQPNTTQFGFLTLNTAFGQLQSTGQTAVLNHGKYQVTSPTNPAPQAVGSIDQDIAVVTGVSGGVNTVTLLTPQGYAPDGTITLDDSNQLADLSESFRPQLVGSALIDVQGDIQSVRAQDAQGMVLNDAGNLNLVKINSAANSVIIGQPFGHAQMPRRTNVSILTTSRTVGDRNGVTIDPNLDQIGPLSLP